MHIVASSRGRPSKAGRIATAIAALPVMFLLCAFMRPQLPETIYDGTRHSTLIETYQHAYARIGMTAIKVVTEATSKAPDGTVSTVKTYTFACPSVSGSHTESCAVTFSISASVKNDICRDCRVTRTSYFGDPAAEEKATTEIRRVLGRLAVSTVAAPAGIACTQAQPGVETSICARPDLLQVDQRIAVAFARLRAAFQGEDAAGFVAGQKSWLIERNNCSNAKATGEFPDVGSCLAERMEQRASLLEHLMPTHEALLATVASYRFVEPEYVNRYADAYADHEVKVVGTLLLDACDGHHADSHDGHIQHKSGSLAVRLARLDQERLEALCHQRPFAWWPGTIQAQHGKPVLLVSEIR